MSETRDFSGLKDAEGWSQVRYNRRPPMQKPNVQRQRFDVEQERRNRVDAQRKAEEDRLRQAELSEVNFPSLASAFGAAPKPSAWARSGTELATAWKQADEEHAAQQQAEEYARQQAEDRERRERERYLGPRRFTRVTHAQEEDTYYEDEEEPPANGGAGYAPPPQDGWERVQKRAKPRRSKNSIEQEDDEPPTVWDVDPDGDYVDTVDWTARPGRRNNDSLY